MNLPADLLSAIANPGGGRIVLVVGAGCSVEPPTGLPLARDCALEAHRRLIADRVLKHGDCANPHDLSSVADSVVAVTGNQQALVGRLPLGDFRHAQPNEGYLLAAAMLREQAVACMVTLNFDLAMSTALTYLGATDVPVVAGPEDHHLLGVINLIYLHRNVDADPEEWVLRTSALADDWRDRWEGVITQRVIGAPVTVFAGLGTPAAVLLESTRRIRRAVPNDVMVYQVDPGPPESSAFFGELALSDDAFLQMEWGAFMSALAGRLLEEHRVELETACDELTAIEAWEAEDVGGLCARLAEAGLIPLGHVRARWMLDNASYVPRRAIPAAWLADLILAIGLLERSTDSHAIFGEDGVVEFRQEGRILGSVVLAHGRGIRRWLALEAKILSTERHWGRHDPQPRYALVAGVQGDRPKVSPPEDVVLGERSDDIVRRYNIPRMISVDELRRTPNLAEEALS